MVACPAPVSPEYGYPAPFLFTLPSMNNFYLDRSVLLSESERRKMIRNDFLDSFGVADLNRLLAQLAKRGTTITSYDKRPGRSLSALSNKVVVVIFLEIEVQGICFRWIGFPSCCKFVAHDSMARDRYRMMLVL